MLHPKPSSEPPEDSYKKYSIIFIYIHKDNKRMLLFKFHSTVCCLQAGIFVRDERHNEYLINYDKQLAEHALVLF